MNAYINYKKKKKTLSITLSLQLGIYEHNISRRSHDVTCLTYTDTLIVLARTSKPEMHFFGIETIGCKQCVRVSLTKIGPQY